MTALPFNRHAVTAEDSADWRRQQIDERIRSDRAEVEQIDEAILQDVPDPTDMVTELIEASRSKQTANARQGSTGC